MMHVLYSFPRLNSNIFPLALDQLNTLQGTASLDDENNIFKVSGAFSLSTARGLIKERVQSPSTWILTSKLLYMLEFKYCYLIISACVCGRAINHLCKVNEKSVTPVRWSLQRLKWWYYLGEVRWSLKLISSETGFVITQRELFFSQRHSYINKVY